MSINYSTITDGQLTETLSDEELIVGVKTADPHANEYLKTLISRHSGIYYSMASKYLRNAAPGLRNEVMDEKDSVIHSAIIRYDPEKGTKFSTFLGNETRWACMNSTNKRRKYEEKHVPLDDVVNFKEFGYESNDVDKHDGHNILSSFFKETECFEDKRVAKIFKLRYENNNKPLAWKKISEEVGLSIQGCINVHDSALKILKKKIVSAYGLNS